MQAVTVMELALEDWLTSGVKGLDQFCTQKHLQVRTCTACALSAQKRS